MKKLGIFTLISDDNFGNRLQNYAVQETFKKYDIEVETISNQLGIYGINHMKKIIKNTIKRFMFFVPKYARLNNFMKFNKKNIKYSKYYIDKDHIPESLSTQYDYYITGSDQVWNPNFSGRSDIDFLTFAPKEKRNAFSASFGISEIPENVRERYKKNLEEMNFISVREDRAKEMIEELTGRKDIEVLVDPTMLLTSEEWDKIAKENNCEIINLMDSNDPLYVSGPSEFLYLIKNAFLVCTDSFHGVVFSIIYNTPFVIFDRKDNNKNMNSRLDTLLNKFNLQYRKFNGKIEKEIFESDYKATLKILESEQDKSKKFIEKIINN